MEEIRECCKTKTENEARKEVCVTKIEEMGDVEHEKPEEQRKREEEDEFGEKKIPRKSDPRQLSEQERTEHEMTHLPFRSWCRQCVKGREPAVTKQLKKREWDKSQNPVELHIHGQRKGRVNVGVLGGQRKRDESRTQHGDSEEVDGRLDMSKADGMGS